MYYLYKPTIPVVLLHPRRVVRDELPVLLVLLAADVRVHAASEPQPHLLAPGQVAPRGARPTAGREKHQNDHISYFTAC